MKEIIIFDPAKDDLQETLRHARLVRVIGVIVTEPSPNQLIVAHEFGVEILPMFGKAEQALETAQKLSEASDSAVVVIRRETDVEPYNRPFRQET